MKNNQKKKILILTCERGGKGHIMPALSIKKAISFKAKDQVQTKIVDIYDYLSLKGSKAFNSTYIFFSKYFPTIVKVGFNISNSKFLMSIITYSHYLNYGKKIKELYLKEKPDLVINNFPHWQHLSWLIWNKYYPDKPFVSLITDSKSVHHGWTMGKIKNYIVSDDETKKELIKRGKTSKNIRVFGIPVNLDFAKKPNRAKVLQKLGLSTKNFTCLFLLSSKKEVKIVKIIKNHLIDLNLILVSGRNADTAPLIDKLIDDRTISIGWTNQMPSLIMSSDIIITKAGGSTIAECLAAKKPMIIYKVIPGQEEGNATFIEQKRLGIVQKKYVDISDSINNIHKNYQKYLSRLKKYSKPKAALDIADYLLSLL